MSQSVITLDDAITMGQGIERPFQCPEHGDNHASATVNIYKGVWYCHACFASGTVDGKKTPSAAALAAMVHPEKACRTYPDSWYVLFERAGYWATRFPEWLCWILGLGEDPFTGDAVFPVRTAHGKLAGVGRRLAEPGPDDPKYKYPLRWSASRTLGFLNLPHNDNVIVLTEGAADAAACWEVGARAFPCYGAGLHLPQIELVKRLNPKVVVTGFDMDEAGERATIRAYDELNDFCDVVQAEWPAKDPADCMFADRFTTISKAVKTVSADLYDQVCFNYPLNNMRMEEEYATHLEEL